MVLEVPRSERSGVQIAWVYRVHHTTLSKWKHPSLEYGAEVFGTDEEVAHYKKWACPYCMGPILRRHGTMAKTHQGS